MTVQELIDVLEEVYDKELPVVVRGTTDNIQIAGDVREVILVPDEEDDEYLMEAAIEDDEFEKGFAGVIVE